jgi:hypothetical protein
MHKGVKHKAKLSNCDECDYSCNKNKVPVMHKFRKHGGQEPPRKLCELCDFTCQTSEIPVRRKIKIKSSSVMSVNINVLKGIL